MPCIFCNRSHGAFLEVFYVFVGMSDMPTGVEDVCVATEAIGVAFKRAYTSCNYSYISVLGRLSVLGVICPNIAVPEIFIDVTAIPIL